MNIFQKYIAYLKDNPEGYWFKRKLFGWGWTPVKWQGWLIILIYIAGLLFFAFTIDDQSTNREILFTFILPLILLTVTLIRICYKKGEKPKWMWGFPKSETKDN